MNIQSTLAKRYIFSQKRHSVLTICSIAAAISLMTILFVGFSVVLNFQRALAYDEAPYHCMVGSITAKQAEILCEDPDIMSCEIIEDPSNPDIQQGQILFRKFIKDELVVIERAFAAAGLPMEDEAENSSFYLNTDLMQYDLVGIQAWYTIATYFALFFVAVILLVMAMRLVIDTAFEISSKERERQFGALQSIGATPNQIVKIITLEGTIFSLIGIPLGLLCGIGLTYLVYAMIVRSGLLEIAYTPEKIERLLRFTVEPWMLVVCAGIGYFWVWLSAYSTGMRIIRMSPIQAITSRSNTVERVKKHSIYGLLCGWSGKLAARNARRSKKRFWITVVSLTISITLFSTSSYAINGFIDSYERYLVDMGVNYDFLVTYAHKSENALAYLDAITELEQSGYFKDIAFETGTWGKITDNSDYEAISILYYNQTTYENFFYDKPSVSYEELKESGKYLMLAYPSDGEKIKNVLDEDSLSANIAHWNHLSVEAYEALTPEEQEQWHPETQFDEQSGEEILIRYDSITFNPQTYPILKNIPYSDITLDAPEDDTLEDGLGSIILIGAIETYEQCYTDYGFPAREYEFHCNLAEDDSYYDAVRFLEAHDTLSLEWDVYRMNESNRSTFTITRMIVTFLSLMLAIISIVNMINIISTGILNRRSELATMQCIGMTKGQMYRMTVIECMQYVLTSGIVASLVSIAIMVITAKFSELMTGEALESVIDYTGPQPMIWLCTAAAFGLALVTAFFSIQGLRKQSLVDQIRSID